MCLHGCQSKSRIIQCARGRTGTSVYRRMCHLFSVDRTLDRVKAKCWQLYPCMMINISCMDLPYIYVCFCASAIMHACIYICVCVHACFLHMPIFVLAHLVRCCCHRSVKRVPRWRALVCRLSVWRWRHRGLSRKLGSLVWKERKRAWDPSIHPCIHPHSPTKPQTRSRESRAGEEGKVEKQRKRETIWVYWKSESDICKSTDTVRVLGLLPFSWQD